MLLVLYLALGTGMSVVETALGPPHVNLDLWMVLKVLGALAVLEACVLVVLVWQALTRGD